MTCYGIQMCCGGLEALRKTDELWEMNAMFGEQLDHMSISQAITWYTDIYSQPSNDHFLRSPSHSQFQQHPVSWEGFSNFLL